MEIFYKNSLNKDDIKGKKITSIGTLEKEHEEKQVNILQIMLSLI